MAKKMSPLIRIPEPPLSLLFFADTRFSLVWLVLRLYIGWQWFIAGYEKIISPAWIGSQAGSALTGFLLGALKKTAGQHPDVSGWYGFFIKEFAINHAVFFSYLVSYGELLVGVALILGIFTGIAAFFGSFMNMNYLFAGTISVNPIMFLAELLLILAWRTAGWYGLDRYVLALLGTPWQPGSFFKRKTS